MDSNQLETSTTQSGFCRKCGQEHVAAELCPNGSGNGASSDNDMLGRTIGGKYQIIDMVGEGGMSVVYKARQFPINKIVALKMLLRHLSSDPISSQRFLQEAKAAGQISHPNIVSVLDYGRDEKNHPYLVMDFLEGQSLADLLKQRGRLPYEEAIPLFTQVCDGLAAAHAHNVIHRDMKPSNIVIQAQGNGEKTARIVDFGIAKVIDAETQALTKTGEVFGSPLYMSPEQCEGVPLDSRSDIYSLGVVFFETLSGVRPFAGKTALETMWMHTEQIAPSLQKVAEGASIPLTLENIVFKMMEKDREKRYANVSEIKKELLQLAAGDSKALSGNLQYVGRELSRKSKVLVAISVCLLLITLAGLFSYPYACAAVAKQQFEQGKEALKNNDFSAAESLLRSSVDLNHRANDRKSEGRGLKLLAQVYRHEGKQDKLSEVRARRQDLIKEQLEQMDLNSDSVEKLLSAAATGADADETPVISSMVTNSASGKGGAGADSVAETSQALPYTADKKQRSELQRVTYTKKESYEPGTAQKFKRQKSESFGGRRRASGGWSSGPISTSDAIDAESGDSFAGGGGTRGNLTGISSIPRSQPSASSSNSGASLVFVAPPLLPGSGGQGFSSANGLNQISEDDTDKLDRLEAACELCIEKKSYKRALECADLAIAVFSSMRLETSSELAGLYSARAWAAFNCGDMVKAEHSATRALIAARQVASKDKDAEACTVLKAVYTQKRELQQLEQIKEQLAKLGEVKASVIMQQANAN